MTIQPGLIAMTKSTRKLVLVEGQGPSKSDQLGQLWRATRIGKCSGVTGSDPRSLLINADDLTPIAYLSTDEAEALAKAQAVCDLNDALKDLRVILERQELSEDDLANGLEAAASQAVLMRAMRRMPVTEALEELSFLKDRDSLSSWDWFGVHEGSRLHVVALPDPFGGWSLVGSARTPREVMHDQRQQPWGDDVCLGEVAAAVLGFWREIFGPSAQPPGSISMGEIYAKHQRDLAKVKAPVPRLTVDGPAFRAIRRVVVDRYRCMPDVPVDLIQSDETLALVVDGTTFGIPARGVWAEPWRTTVGTLAAIQPARLRGQGLTLWQEAWLVG